MARYHHGQIVYATVTGHDGIAKDRTLLILSSDKECTRGDDLLVLGISSRRKQNRPFYHVCIHNSEEKDPQTGLDRPSWVLCNFWDELEQRLVRRAAGTLPDHLLKKILEVFDALQADEAFDDWPPR